MKKLLLVLLLPLLAVCVAFAQETPLPHPGPIRFCYQKVEDLSQTGAILRDIVTQGHGGTLTVASKEEATDVNALVGEYAELAYHGKRAQTPGFNVTLERDLGAEVGAVEMVDQVHSYV